MIQNGVEAETIVAVLLERGIKVYTATQGILKAGGAFTCISAEYAKEFHDSLGLHLRNLTDSPVQS